MSGEEEPEDNLSSQTKAHLTRNKKHKLRKKLSRLGKV
jgi:hypothetical protein